MMDTGTMRLAMGDNVFSKYKINPPWERIHAAILWLYIAFLVTFGFASVSDNPSCLPINGNNTDELTDPEAKFVSDYCEEIGDHDNPDVTIEVVLISLIYQKIISSICLGILGLTNTFSTFAKAEKIFSQLPETKTDGKGLFRKILDDPASTKLRDIAELLWGYEPGKTALSVVSREIALFTGTVGNAVAIWYWVSTTPVTPTFQCDAAVEFGWSASNSTEFICTRPWILERNSLAWFYLVTVMIHVTIRFYSLNVTAIFLARVKPHPKIKSAKGFLLVNKLWMASRTKDECKFGEFVAEILSEKALHKMENHIKSVGREADPLLAKFTVATASSRPQVHALVREQRWKWVIYLLQKKFEELDSPEVLGESAPDEDGNSLLFYALNRTAGVHFSVHAALKVMNFSNTLVCDNVKMSAEEFIEDQYLNDSSYPERLKNHLISAIGGTGRMVTLPNKNLIDINDTSTN